MGHMGVGKTCQPGGLVAGRTNPKNPPQVYHTHTHRGREPQPRETATKHTQKTSLLWEQKYQGYLEEY